MRAAIRLDCAGLPPGELMVTAHRLRAAAAERRLDQRRQAGVGQGGGAEAGAGADHALEPEHGHPVAPPEEIERELHRSDLGRAARHRKARWRRPRGDRSKGGPAGVNHRTSASVSRRFSVVFP